MNPYISIIIPCYNAENFLEQAICSVLHQSFENWEMILINDGSYDGTESICELFSNKDKRIRYLSSENCGAGHARNLGIQAAKGTWIVFLDADDLFLTESLNIPLYERLSKWEECSVDVIYTSIARGKDMNLREPIRFFRPEMCEQIVYRPNLAFGNGIYRASFLKRDEIAFFEYQEQDIETAFRYIVFTEAKKKISEPNIAFYLQRENPVSNTHTWSHVKLHYIKTLVYDQLLEKYHNKLNCNYLFEEVVNEVHEFYRSCVRAGLRDINRIKRINEIYRTTVFNLHGKCVTQIGKRHWFTNFAYCVLANLLSLFKRSIDKTKGMDKLMIDDTYLVMKRLKSISNYIQVCLVEDRDENC